MDGLEWSSDFGTGTTFDIFHRTGKQPDWIERLKSLVTEGAILEAVAFSIRAETPSGPFDFVVSRVFSNHCTSSTEHSSSSGHSCVWSSSSRNEKSSGGRYWLRHSPKKEFSMSAFSTLLEATDPFRDSTGGEEGFFVKCLTVF